MSGVSPSQRAAKAAIDPEFDAAKSPAKASENHLADASIMDLQLGVGVGFRFKNDAYRPDDAYIAQDPVRVAATNAIKERSGQDVTWVETGGLSEISGGFHMNIPLIPTHWGGMGTNFGALSSNLMYYRVIKPVAGKSAPEGEKLLSEHRFQLPSTVASAKNLPLGYEYEVTGQTQLRADATLAFRAGPTAGPITLGLGVTATADFCGTRLVAVRVIALDGKNKVRVFLRDLTQKIEGTGLKAQLGLIAVGGGLVPAPYNGQLKYIAEQQGQHTIEGLITWYTTFTAMISKKLGDQDTTLCAFDFDLSKEGIKESYERLFQLDTEQAIKLAMKKDSGVELVRLKEHEASNTQAEALALFGQKFLTLDTSTVESRGEIQDHGGFLIYKDKHFKEKFTSLLTADKEVDWEQVRFCKKTEPVFCDYYHFHYARVDQRVTQDEANAFVHFAKALGVSLKGEVNQHIDDIPLQRKLFTRDGQMTFGLDLYFNPKAAHKIEATTEEEALRAYLQAATQISSIYAQLPLVEPSERGQSAFRIMKAYRDCQKTRSFFSPTRVSMSQKLRDAYKKLTGRLLATDEALFKRAEEFASRVGAIKKLSNPDEMGAFFSKLGESKEFDYMESILALNNLVGNENCLVHQFALEGCGMRMKGQDEGLILSPKDEGYMALYRPVAA